MVGTQLSSVKVNQTEHKTEWKFLIPWILGNLIASMTFSYITLFVVESSSGNEAAYAILRWVVITTIQWALLRKYLLRARWWYLVTLLNGLLLVYVLYPPFEKLGSGIASEFSQLMGFLVYGFILRPAFNITFGFILGFSQWLVFRLEFKYAGWWIAVKIVASLLAGLFYYSTFLLVQFFRMKYIFILQTLSPGEYLFLFSLSDLTAYTIMGIALVYLFRYPLPQTPAIPKNRPPESP